LVAGKLGWVFGPRFPHRLDVAATVAFSNLSYAIEERDNAALALGYRFAGRLRMGWQTSTQQSPRFS